MSPAGRAWVRLLILCAVSFAMVSALRAAGVQLSGSVRDEHDAPVAGAKITVSPAPPGSGGPWQTTSDPTGAYSITLPSPGNYLVDVQRQGFYEVKDRPVDLQTSQEVNLTVNSVQEVFQSVDVTEQPSPVDITQTNNQERLTGTEVNDNMYTNSHDLRDAMTMMPGVIQDATGGLHFNGSSENQVQYQLNGFNLTNPVTGLFQTTLAVEGIQSMDYSSGRYSPQYGKGSAGVLSLKTENGADVFHFTATDFVPGVDIRQGIRLGNWYPRFGVSGPIVKGRAWFSDTFNSIYTTELVPGLPSGQNTRSGWEGTNLLHTQINVTPRDIVFADFLLTVDNEGRIGLTPLDPVSTTLTERNRQYFGSVKDQLYLGGRSLIEIGYAHNEFTNRQTPQGQNLYVLSSLGRSGNYFLTSNQTSSRDQFLLHGYAPQFQLAGSHQIEAGVDTDLLHYNADNHRTGYEVENLSGQILSETTFFGSGIYSVHNTEAAAWVLDTWRIAKRFQIDAGLREDWNQIVSGPAWSPRLSFSWAPFADGHTRVAGGYAVTHDAAILQPFGQDLDQTALTTEYGTNGLPEGPPAPTTFVPGTNLKLPRATNWSLSADRQITTHVTASVKYLRRRGTDGFSFLNLLAPDAPPSLLPLASGTTPGTFQLTNLRRDDYDSIQFAVRQTFAGQHEWMVSYTWSRAESNAVLDPYTLEPLQVLPGMVPMPWDAPNRLLAYAYLPLPWKKWSVAILTDARNGFPFSVEQITGMIGGLVDSHRYPFNFDLNVGIERMITLRGRRFALRVGANNLTDSRNPTSVNNVIGSPTYLQFLGDEGRHYVVRIRFFGKTESK